MMSSSVVNECLLHWGTGALGHWGTRALTFENEQVGERVDKGRNGKEFDAAAPWSRSADDAAVLDEDKVGKVVKLIADRDTARAVRDYSAADAIRDQLHAQFGVAVDDEVREWKVGPRVDKVLACRV